MSETTTQETEAELQPGAVEPDAQIQETESQVQETEEQQEQPRPSQGDRRVAQFTARNAALQAELAEASRRADAAEALLREGRQEQTPTAEAEAMARQMARQMVVQETFNAKLNAVIESGSREFTPAGWTERAGVLYSMGATTNAVFMEALVEQPNAPAIVAALAEDVDRLTAILSKPPAALAAELGRMSAKLETTEAPKPPVSRAPSPPRPVAPVAAGKEPDIYDDKISMEDFVRIRNKTAPRRLGGRG